MDIDIHVFYIFYVLCILHPPYPHISTYSLGFYRALVRLHFLSFEVPYQCVVITINFYREVHLLVEWKFYSILFYFDIHTLLTWAVSPNASANTKRAAPVKRRLKPFFVVQWLANGTAMWTYFESNKYRQSMSTMLQICWLINISEGYLI